MPYKRHVKRKLFKDMYFSGLVKESNILGGGNYISEKAKRTIRK